METLLEIHDIIVKTEKNTILDVPKLDVRKGEVLVLIGPNGAGKSTLLYVAAGLKMPTSGSVFFTEAPKLSGLKYRRKISTVFQTPLLLSDTVENNISSGLKFHGLQKNDIKERVTHWMDLLKITHLAKRQAKSLSGGEAQRVSLARALCLETSLILMDEPFSSLDTPTKQEILDDLRQIFARTNQTCVYVTHDLEEALTIGDRVAVLFNGKLHQLGSTQEAFERPATPEVATYMGVENIIPGQVVEVSQDLLRIQAGKSGIDAIGACSIGTKVFVCLRPEDITLYPADQEIKPSTARNRLSCRITYMVNQGPLYRVQMEAGFNLTALITRPSAQELNLAPGKDVVAVFKATAVHLIYSGKSLNEQMLKGGLA